MQDKKNQFLLFLVDGLFYAIEALRVSEIVEYERYTKVPMLQSFMMGVTNIRGNIISVIDLKDRFGFGSSNIGKRSSIIVVNVMIENENTQMGFLVDEVYEVSEIDADSLKSVPEFGSKIDGRFIERMGKFNGEYIPILDIDTLFDIEELSRLVA